MSFLTPLLFAGLAALIVPILVHLVQRQQQETTAFPSLMFLRDIPYKQRLPRTIRHWFLLALRCLALALIVFAFTRPFFQWTDDAAAGFADRRDVVILLDRSYSMGYEERWRDAQQKALAELDKLVADDQTTLVLFDETVLASGPLSNDYAAVRAAINRYQPSASGTDMTTALIQAGQLLRETSTAPQREIVLISDFQRISIDPDAKLRLPPGVTLTPIDVSSETTSNIALVSAQLRETEGKTEIIASVLNSGAEDVDDVTLAVEIDGREREAQNIKLAAKALASVTFELPPARDLALRGVLRLKTSTDLLPQDDTFYFMLTPRAELSVLIVEDTSPRTNQSFFLQRALELGERPAYKIETRRGDTLRSADLENRTLIILNDTPIPGGQLGTGLQDFVSNGGGLLVIAADRVQGGWPSGADGFLPGKLERSVERQGGAIRQLDYDHPILALFATPPRTDLANAQVRRYRQLQPADGDRVLAHYDDGAAALIERQVGTGRVLVLTTTLDTHWNDLALQATFVPFLHQVSSYLSGYQTSPAWATVGEVVDLARQAQGSPGSATLVQSETLIAEAPSGIQTRVAGTKALLSVSESGFYEIHGDDGSEIALAVNINATESDLTRLDAASFVASLQTDATESNPIETLATNLTPLEQEQGQRLWWYLLLAALLFLAAETVLSNRLSRRLS